MARSAKVNEEVDNTTETTNENVTIKSNDIDLVKMATEMAKSMVSEMMKSKSEPINEPKKENQLINCLRPGEKVIVRFIKKKRGFVDDPNSPLYGGMGETSTIRLVVPKLNSGGFKNPLTTVEKNYLEYVLGVDLSVYGKPNYWSNRNPESVNYVTLSKVDKVLDLGDPRDYIRYKILLLNSNIVCPSLQELEDHPKMTYRFVITNETTEANNVGKRARMKSNAYIKLSEFENNRLVLRTIIRLMEGNKAGRNEAIEYLYSRVTNLLEADLRRFNEIINDPLLQTKAYIDEAVEKGIIRLTDNKYYLREGNIPLCNDNEEPRLNIAAAYLASPANQDIRDMIIAKCND